MSGAAPGRGSGTAALGAARKRGAHCVHADTGGRDSSVGGGRRALCVGGGVAAEGGAVVPLGSSSFRFRSASCEKLFTGF